jgi:hypothetical protein
MTEDFSFRQAKPGIEVSVKPRMAQPERLAFVGGDRMVDTRTATRATTTFRTVV